ncbi:MAG TPA: hypothetical protein VKB51_12460 [bacterium]|nr:hypothetical protein [bacterium]
MSRFPSPEWMRAFQEQVNRDEELLLIGQWFTTDFLFGAGETEVLFRVRAGRLVEVVPEPRFDQPWSFALRAPQEHWEKFIQPLPPPLFNEIFAMLMRVPEFRVEGNTLVAAQNARALQRFMSLMRKVGQ